MIQRIKGRINRLRYRHIIRQMKRTGKRMDDRDLELKMLEEGLERMRQQLDEAKG